MSMKKFVVLLVAFVISFTSLTFAGVVDLNLSEMSTDELLELRKAVNEELNNRFGSVNDDYIYYGEYIVGEDIAPGRYLFSVVESYSNGKIYVKDTPDDTYSSMMEYLNEESAPYSFVLEEGNLFVVDNLVGKIAPYNPTWN